MRTIIAGSRDFNDYGLMCSVIAACVWRPSVVLCGAARGADRLGWRWGDANGVPVEFYAAQWRHLGLRAGRVRNIEMAQKAEALIAFWDGESPGTRHMIEVAQKRSLWIDVTMVNRASR